jgi:hypothetical protein
MKDRVEDYVFLFFFPFSHFFPPFLKEAGLVKNTDLVLAKAAALRITLNLDGSPITSK